MGKKHRPGKNERKKSEQSQSNVKEMRISLLDDLFTQFFGLNLIDKPYQVHDIYFAKTVISSLTTTHRGMISFVHLSVFNSDLEELNSRGFSINLNLSTEHYLKRTEANFTMKYGWGKLVFGCPMFNSPAQIKHYHCDGREIDVNMTVETNEWIITPPGTLFDNETFIVIVEIEGGFVDIRHFTARMQMMDGGNGSEKGKDNGNSEDQSKSSIEENCSSH